jgi:hypothetical protein
MSHRTFTPAILMTVAALSALMVPASLEAQDDDNPVLAIPEGYVYDAAGRRDPFVNPIPPPPPSSVGGPMIPDVRPAGLPGVLLNEASLSGVVNSDRGDSMVVVEAPGSRTFIAREGDELLDVVIAEIRSDSVVFEVKPVDGLPEPVERERVVRSVNAAPGE